jgi:hypothetical protein
MVYGHVPDHLNGHKSFGEKKTMEQYELTEESLQEVTGGDISNGQAVSIGAGSFATGALVAGGAAKLLRKPGAVGAMEHAAALAPVKPLAQLESSHRVEQSVVERMAAWDRQIKENLKPIRTR